MKTLLQAAWIAPMLRPLMRDGAVIFEGDRLLDAGLAATLRARHPDANKIDLGHSIILPGLVNAHAHLELSHANRTAAPKSLADWLLNRVREAGRDDLHAIRAATVAGARESLQWGITCIGNITANPAITRSQLAKESLRGVSFGEVRAMAGRRHLLARRLATAIEPVTEHGNRTAGNFSIGISPHAPYSIEPAGYEACLAAARSGAPPDDPAPGLPLTTHLAESPDEADFLANHSGPLRALWSAMGQWDEKVPTFAGGPIRLARALGLLDYPSLLAHVNYCDDAELAILAAGRASVVYCPRTHAYFGHPPHRWREMLAAGINVVLGTDSRASSPNLNLLDDLREARKQTLDAAANLDVDPAQEVAGLWELVTTRAASALGMAGQVGALTAGAFADLAVFAASSNDPLRAILDEGRPLRQTWFAGQLVFDAGLAVGA